MQVSSISVAMGFTMNVGDFQSVKVEFGMRADLDRNENEDEAAATLRSKVLANLVACGADAHPDRLRAQVGAGTQAALPAPAATKEPAKRGPKPKDTALQGQAGGNGVAATVAPKTSVTAASPSEPTLEDELNDNIPANGGGSANLLDEGDDLLSDAEPEITKEVLTAKCRELIAKSGNPALLKIFKTVGADSMKTVTVDKYQTLYAKVVAALAA